MRELNEKLVGWSCPTCGWVESDACYLSIVFDPDCPGCGATKYSDFQYCDDIMKPTTGLTL